MFIYNNLLFIFSVRHSYAKKGHCFCQQVFSGKPTYYIFQLFLPTFTRRLITTNFVFSHFSDIILDNAGYELFNDLVFADFLIWSGIAEKVVFHGKNMPWFVSDVTLTDFNLMFECLETKIQTENTTALVNSWREYLNDGKYNLVLKLFDSYGCRESVWIFLIKKKLKLNCSEKIFNFE